MDLPERIKNLRANKDNMSQRELAKDLNIAPSTIAMYETGQRDPDTATLKILADYFNVSTDYLLGRTDDPSPPTAEEDPDSDLQPTPRDRIKTFQKKLGELSPESLDFLEHQINRLRELDLEVIERKKADQNKQKPNK